MICTNHGNIERVFHIELVLFKMKLCKKVNVACKMIAVKDPSYTKKNSLSCALGYRGEN